MAAFVVASMSANGSMLDSRAGGSDETVIDGADGRREGALEDAASISKRDIGPSGSGNDAGVSVRNTKKRPAFSRNISKKACLPSLGGACTLTTIPDFTKMVAARPSSR